MKSHDNNTVPCLKCKEIFDRYPYFWLPLRTWFEEFQKSHPEAHISCAGRGRQAQEDAYNHGTSRAKYGQSAHSYNCAIDLFFMVPGKDLYDKELFHQIVEPNIPEDLEWYGVIGSPFYELAHVQVRAWKDLVYHGLVHLVEPLPDYGETDMC